jgi:hypothetical protein
VGSDCQGVCAPGQTQCAGSGNNQPQSCDATGNWANNGAACGGRVCVSGQCTGADCTSVTVPACNGDAGCDLRSNTCCVTPHLPLPIGQCVAGTTEACTELDGGPSPTHCIYSCDCPAGQSCCGELNSSSFKGEAVCETLANGASCAVGAGFTVANQICLQDEECKNGQKCIAQTCIFSSHFHFCGLHAESPYFCTADSD